MCVAAGTNTPSHEYEVVVVTYHSRDKLAALLSTLPNDQPIVVVDNASGTDGTRQVIEGFCKRRWLDGRNSGFAKAANLGARTSEAEYLVFADPDSRPTPEVIDALIDDLRREPMLAITGAGAVDDSGRLELGIGGWEPTLGRSFVSAAGLRRLFTKSGVYASPRRNETVDLEWLGAPCMAVRRKQFIKLGGFDERYFVYNEDMAFGRTVRSAGLHQRLRTDLHVPHAASTSAGVGTAMFQQRGASMAAYLHDHNHPAAAVAMRVLLALGTIPRAALALARRQGMQSRQQTAYLVGIMFRRSPFVR
jgi:GT2 family glycosyltransferase